jgi:hypothetical protein
VCTREDYAGGAANQSSRCDCQLRTEAREKGLYVITKTGPPEPGDRPRKRSRFFFAWLWDAPFLLTVPRFFGLAKAQEIDQRVAAEEAAEEEAHNPWRGIPEAELTDEQREAAARQIHQEDAEGRARRV